jgi:hypothetical protein
MKKTISIFFIISAIFITSCEDAKTNKQTKRKERPSPAPVKKECSSCTSKIDSNEDLEIESVESNDKMSAKVESIDLIESNDKISAKVESIDPIESMNEIDSNEEMSESN